MKRKLLVALPLIILLIIIIIILILTRKKDPEGTPLLNTSDYPVTFQQVGTDIEISLDGSKTPDFTWSAVNRGNDVVEIKPKAEEKKGKITYILSPKLEGSTDVEFVRNGEKDGMTYDAIRFTFPVHVGMTEEGLTVSLEPGQEITGGTLVGGADTEHPFLIKRDDKGELRVEFPKGNADWILFDPNDEVEMLSMLGDNAQMVMVPHVSAAISTDTEDSNNAEGAEGNTTKSSESTKNTESSSEKKELSKEEKHAADVYAQYLELKKKVEAGEVELATVEVPTEASTDANGNYIPYDGPIQIPKQTESEKKLSELKEKYQGTTSVLEDGSKRTLIIAYSESMNATEFIDVVIDTEGKVYMYLGSDPKAED